MTSKFQVHTSIEPHYPVKSEILEKAALAALDAVGVNGKIELAVSVIGDRKMRALNKDFRQIDAPTDVLAFPYSLDTGKPGEFISPPSEYLNLGDIVISYPQLMERAAKEDTLVDEMAALLTIHGVLHILGYDHQDPHQAVEMEAIEDTLLNELYPLPGPL